MKRFSTALLVSLFGSGAFAGDSYFGLGFGNATASDSTYSFTSRNIVGLLGYNLNDNLSVEGELSSTYDKADITVSGVKMGVSNTHAAIFFKGRVNASENLSLHVRAGYGEGAIGVSAGSISVEASDNAAMYGVGLQYNFNPSSGMRIDYTTASLKGTDSKMFTIMPFVYSF